MSAARPPTNRPWRGARDAAHAGMLIGVALLAAGVGVIGLLTGAWNGVENASVDARFSLRPAHHPHNVVVVAIDEKTLDALDLHWPFPRSLDAQAIEALRRDHARTIVYDMQFTKTTAEAPGRPLYRSLARAGNVLLATTEAGLDGDNDLLGGEREPRPRPRQRRGSQLQRRFQRRDPAVPALGRWPGLASRWRPRKPPPGVSRPARPSATALPGSTSRARGHGAEGVLRRT